MRPHEIQVVLSALLAGCATAAPPLAPALLPPASDPPPATASDAPADPHLLAIPGPAAASCTDDATCLHHRCNLAYAKCAFPCASDADCTRGTACFKAVISTCQPRPPNRR